MFPVVLFSIVSLSGCFVVLFGCYTCRVSGTAVVLGPVLEVHPGVLFAVSRACEDAEVTNLPRVVVVLAGPGSLIILKCLQLPRERRPMPSSLTVYCL